ncbi:MAG: PHP domain-containing protein [Candidatus Dormibacteraeota bacterium]|nr:PHP domain-containing protein [Candidatus Dormibacteraeota bacterium]
MPEATSWKVDFHMHSNFSRDSFTQLADLAARAREVGLTRIALTDHNTADGALQLREQEPELVVVGEEIKTTEGEVIGLYLTRTIKAWQRPEAVMDEIHEMGGLVYVPHPFDRWRANFMPHRLVALADRIDVIEGYNQWADRGANDAATRIAAELGKPIAFGSDAHSVAELGQSWLEVEPFEGAPDLLLKLHRAVGHRTELSGTQRRA